MVTPKLRDSSSAAVRRLTLVFEPPAVRTAGVILALVFMTLALVFGPSNSYYSALLIQATCSAVAVLGLLILVGITGQVSLAQAAFAGIGAYSVGISVGLHGWSFWTSMAVGLAVSCVAGAVLGLLCLRVGGHYLAMVTIGFQVIVVVLLNNLEPITGGGNGITGIPRPSIFGHQLLDNRAYLTFCLVVLYAAGAIVVLLVSSPLGRSMRGVRDNELAAEVSGVNTYMIKVGAFTIASVLGALGGELYASGMGYISPDDFNFSVSILYLTMGLAGGIRSVPGAVFGSFLLVMLPEWLRFLSNIYLAVYGVLLILIILVIPDGILGTLIEWIKSFRPPPVPEPTSRALRFDRHLSLSRTDSIIEVSGLRKNFGGVVALDGVDFAVQKGDIHALIGPNGSGKTTFINVLFGIYRPTAGEVRVIGKSTTGRRPHKVAALGIARTFQLIRLLRGLSVLENVLLGVGRGTFARVNRQRDARDRAIAAIDLVSMRHVAGERADQLSYGRQRLVEIARAVAAEPTVLLLDEPAAGLNPAEKLEMANLLCSLKDAGLTILLIEHDMSLVSRVADVVTALNFGKVMVTGSVKTVLNHPDVVEAYLGSGAANEPARA